MSECENCGKSIASDMKLCPDCQKETGGDDEVDLTWIDPAFKF